MEPELSVVEEERAVGNWLTACGGRGDDEGATLFATTHGGVYWCTKSDELLDRPRAPRPTAGGRTRLRSRR